MVSVIKMFAALMASILLGNWFISEVRKARIQEQPWYKPYISLPGLLILICLTIPVIIWTINN